MEKTYIGQGCSRIAYLLPDGRVEKRPRYNASHSSAHAGSPDYVILDELLFEFS